MSDNKCNTCCGFFSRLLTTTLGTFLGLILAVFGAYEYIAWRIETKVEAVVKRVEAAEAKVEAKVDQMKSNLLPPKP
ncbi:hypothetical protein BH11PLA2_BH11PLA2_43310 [soil metagenome]